MSAILSGNDGDFFEAFQAMTYGAGTYTPKKLPAEKVVPQIPARAGDSPRITSSGQASGSSGDMVLKGAKTYTSTDGMLILSFPETAELVIGTTTITLPALTKA